MGSFDSEDALCLLVIAVANIIGIGLLVFIIGLLYKLILLLGG